MFVLLKYENKKRLPYSPKEKDSIVINPGSCMNYMHIHVSVYVEIFTPYFGPEDFQLITWDSNLQIMGSPTFSSESQVDAP